MRISFFRIILLNFVVLGVISLVSAQSVTIDPVTQTVIVGSGSNGSGNAGSGVISSGGMTTGNTSSGSILSGSTGTINTGVTTTGTTGSTPSPILTQEDGLLFSDLPAFLKTVNWMRQRWIFTPQLKELDEAVAWMHQYQITSASKSSEFNAGELLSKWQAARFIAQLIGEYETQPFSQKTSCVLNDIGDFAEMFQTDIVFVCEYGLLKAVQESSYQPYTILKRHQALSLVLKSMDIDLPAEDPYTIYEISKKLKLTNLGSAQDLLADVTRGEFALYLFRMREILYYRGFPLLPTFQQQYQNSLGSGIFLGQGLYQLDGNIGLQEDVEFKEAFYRMRGAGLTRALTREGYSPFESVSRQQLALMIAAFQKNILGVTDQQGIINPGACTFTDVNNLDSSVISAIQLLCKRYIFASAGGDFVPDEKVSKLTFLIVFVRMLEGKLDETPTVRWENYFQKAQQLGLVQQSDRSIIDRPISQYEAALLMYRFYIKTLLLSSANSAHRPAQLIALVDGTLESDSAGVQSQRALLDHTLFQTEADLAYVDTLNQTFKVRRTGIKRYMNQSYVWFGELTTLDKDEKIGIATFVLSQGRVVEGTLRPYGVDTKGYLLLPDAQSSVLYTLKEIK